MQRRRAKAVRNDGFSAIVSTRALIMREPMAGSLAHEGTRPHFAMSSVAAPSAERMIRTCCMGATLYEGGNRRSSFAVIANENASARSWSVSYTHLRAHETKANLVCRLL